MGVDFRMQAVRALPEGRFEPIVGQAPDTPPAMQLLYGLSHGEFEFWTRLGFLEALFRPGHQEGSPAALLRSLLPKDVSFRWFEECYAGAYYSRPPPSTENCFPPREVVSCLQAVLETLRDRADALPPRYVLRAEQSRETRGGLTAVYEHRVYAIRADWGRCEASPTEVSSHIPYPEGDRTIDLRSIPSIRCRPIALGGLLPPRVRDSLGPEMTFLIEKQSCLEWFGPALDAMRSVAAHAETEGALVFTFLS